MSSRGTDYLRLGVWGVQTLIGIIGLWLVGKQVSAAAKSDGWKKVPSNIWNIFWKGE